MSFVLALLATASLHLPTAALAGSALTWVSPVDGIPVVVDGFSPPPPGQPWRRGNRGVDLAAPAGAKVRAAGAGVISFAGPLAGRGVVVIVHGDLRTTYEPVRASVHVGQVVQASQEVGLLEAQPSPCIGQSCLHWGLLRGNQYLDPMLLLATGVRLLPQAVQHAVARGARPASSLSLLHSRFLLHSRLLLRRRGRRYAR
jgi:murein DD-endopeptidase MepM/ murein hydrolase activator NlpD